MRADICSRRMVFAGVKSMTNGAGTRAVGLPVSEQVHPELCQYAFKERPSRRSAQHSARPSLVKGLLGRRENRGLGMAQEVGEGRI